MRKIPWQSRKELHLQLAAGCAVYHGLPPWFSMHFKSIATFLAKPSANEKKIRSVDERWHLRSANSASITSPSHWPRGDVWVRACNVWLPQGPSYSMNVVVHSGKQRLCKPRDCQNSHLFPNRATTAKRRPAVLSTVRKVWMVRSTGAGARKLFERRGENVYCTTRANCRRAEKYWGIMWKGPRPFALAQHTEKFGILPNVRDSSKRFELMLFFSFWKSRSPTKRHAETDTV